MWRYWMAAVAAAFAPFAAPALAQAQSPENYPSKTVTLVVPYAAGGSTDIISRLLASELQTQWGQTVIVENKPGASGFIGARTVAQADPDGYTLMMGIAGLLTATLVADPSPFDLTRDFTPVLQAGRVPAVFAVPLNSRFTSMPDLIQHLKKGNADLSIGNWGTGSVPHIQAALLASQLKAQLVHVSYGGGGPLAQAIAGGHIEAGFVDYAGLRSSLDRVRALAVTGDAPNPALPEVPTLRELGLHSFESYGWYGLFAPSGTPKPIVDTIATDVARILETPQMKERLRSLGIESVSEHTPMAFAHTIAQDSTIFSKAIQEAGLRVKQ